MAASMADVMDQLGAQLSAIPGLRVYDFPPDSAQPPFAFVNLPDRVDYHLTMAGGAARFSLRVYVGVSAVVDRVARDTVAAYAAQTGAVSVRRFVESPTVGFVLDDVVLGVLDVGVLGALSGLSTFAVRSSSFTEFTLAAGTYAGIVFDVDYAG